MEMLLVRDLCTQPPAQSGTVIIAGLHQLWLCQVLKTSRDGDL